MAKVLDRIHSAVVLLDADAPDFPEAALEVEEYFRKKKIPLKLKAVHRHSLILADRKAELFLSLLPEKNWHLALDARMSKAIFKVGRFQLKGDVFDLVLSSGSGFGQIEVFRRMTQIMQQIS